MRQERLLPPPDWTAIFSVRFDLAPPGYDELFIAIADGEGVRPKKKKARSKGKEGRFPSLKHGAD